MKRSTKYVALDIHQATNLASVRAESGRVIARTILPTEEPARTYQNVVEDSTREMQRPKAKAAIVAEARQDPARSVLMTIPFLGPIRVALLLATMRTPWRFRTKRHLWAYSGLAVVTHASADHTLVDGRPVRRRRAPMTRGMCEELARVTLTRKFVALTLSLWKKGERSDPTKLTLQAQ